MVSEAPTMSIILSHGFLRDRCPRFVCGGTLFIDYNERGDTEVRCFLCSRQIVDGRAVVARVATDEKAHRAGYQAPR